MSKTVQSASFKDIVSDIESFYAENSVSAYCPWACTTLAYKPLSVLQIREFIELQISAQKDDNQILGVFDVIEHMNKVLVDNCTDSKSEITKTLNIIDRDAVMIQLRAFTKHELSLNDNYGELVNVDLNDIVKEMRGKRPPKSIKSQTKTFKFESGQVELELSLPTVHKDTLINNVFKAKFKPKLKQTSKKVEQVVEKLLGEMYFIELCKYIDTLTITKGDSESTVLRFDSIDTLPQSMQLLEKLPSNTVGAISSYIEEVKTYRDSFLSYTDSQDNQASLEVDANIFTGI